MEALGIEPKTGSEKAATNRLIMYRKQLVTHLIQAGPEKKVANRIAKASFLACLLYTSPSPRDRQKSRMPSSA